MSLWKQFIQKQIKRNIKDFLKLLNRDKISQNNNSIWEGKQAKRFKPINSIFLLTKRFKAIQIMNNRQQSYFCISYITAYNFNSTQVSCKHLVLNRHTQPERSYQPLVYLAYISWQTFLLKNLHVLDYNRKALVHQILVFPVVCIRGKHIYVNRCLLEELNQYTLTVPLHQIFYYQEYWQPEKRIIYYVK